MGFSEQVLSSNTWLYVVQQPRKQTQGSEDSLHGNQSSENQLSDSVKPTTGEKHFLPCVQDYGVSHKGKEQLFPMPTLERTRRGCLEASH
jgi:hypothetical protein